MLKQVSSLETCSVGLSFPIKKGSALRLIARQIYRYVPYRYKVTGEKENNLLGCSQPPIPASMYTTISMKVQPATMCEHAASVLEKKLCYVLEYALPGRIIMQKTNCSSTLLM